MIVRAFALVSALALTWPAPSLAQAPGQPGATRAPRLRGVLQPYPGSTFLARDAAFQSHVRAGRGDEGELEIRVESFTSVASFALVKTYLDAQLHEPMASTLVDSPDVDVAEFVRASDETRVAALGRVVLGDLSAQEFRKQFLQGFEAAPPPSGRLAIGSFAQPDGATTRVEVQEPYFDLGAFQWVSATRVRLIRAAAKPARNSPDSR